MAQTKKQKAPTKLTQSQSSCDLFFPLCSNSQRITIAFDDPGKIKLELTTVRKLRGEGE